MEFAIDGLLDVQEGPLGVHDPGAGVAGRGKSALREASRPVRQAWAESLELRWHECADFKIKLILNEISLNRQFVKELDHEVLHSKAYNLGILLKDVEPVSEARFGESLTV